MFLHSAVNRLKKFNWKNWISSKHSLERVECTFDNQAKKKICHKARNVSVNVEVISKTTFSPKIAKFPRQSVGSHKMQSWKNSQKKSTIGRFFFQCPKQIKFHKFFSKKKFFYKNLYGQVEFNFWKLPEFWARRSKTYLIAQGLKIFEKNDFCRKIKKLST